VRNRFQSIVRNGEQSEGKRIKEFPKSERNREQRFTRAVRDSEQSVGNRNERIPQSREEHGTEIPQQIEGQ
jgi:hypothetical protein